jgi:hypothetical protein
MDYSDYKAQKETQIEKLVNDFSNVVNSMTFGEDENQKFFDEFCRQHRTLQQSMFRVILSLIVKMTGDDYRTDGRNESSKNIAQSLVKGYAEMVKENYLDESPERRGDEFYERKAEEIKQSVINKPEMYFGVPCI